MLAKKNADDVIERLREFYYSRSPNRIFAWINMWKNIPPEEDTYPVEVNRNELPPIESIYPHWERYLLARRDIEDDSLPVMSPYQYDQGLYGAIFGADVVINPREAPFCCSSMNKPMPSLDFTELEKELENVESHPWMKRLEKDLTYLANRSKGRFGIGALITIDALNFLFAMLGGKETYIRVHRDLSSLRKFMSFAVRMNTIIVEFQRRIVDGLCDGGVLDLFGGWLPGRAVPMSVDAYTLCPPHIYRSMGLEFQQQLIDHFKGGIWHLHGNGRHLLPEMRSLKGITPIYVMDDGASTPAFSELRRIRRIIPHVPIIVPCTKEELKLGLRRHTLPGGVLYSVSGVETLQEANDLMREVREYIAPEGSSD